MTEQPNNTLNDLTYKTFSPSNRLQTEENQKSKSNVKVKDESEG